MKDTELLDELYTHRALEELVLDDVRKLPFSATQHIVTALLNDLGRRAAAVVAEEPPPDVDAAAVRGLFARVVRAELQALAYPGADAFSASRSDYRAAIEFLVECKPEKMPVHQPKRGEADRDDVDRCVDVLEQRLAATEEARDRLERALIGHRAWRYDMLAAVDEVEREIGVPAAERLRQRVNKLDTAVDL